MVNEMMHVDHQMVQFTKGSEKNDFLILLLSFVFPINWLRVIHMAFHHLSNLDLLSLLIR